MAGDLCLHPLADTSDAHLQSLGESLWDWKLCDRCAGKARCNDLECPWSRAEKLKRFWTYYKELTASYVPEFLPGSSPALSDQQDLHQLLRRLKTHSELPRSHLTRDYFSERSGSGEKCPHRADQDRAFNLAIQLLFMINCNGSPQISGGLPRAGHMALAWQDGRSVQSVMEEAFRRPAPAFSTEVEVSERSIGVRYDLAAKRLQREAGLRFEGTDDLSRHLKMDRVLGIVEIFQHSAALKESLRASQYGLKIKHDGTANQTGTGLHQDQGIHIPRQVALEILDSFHKILFPPDSESQKLLSSLVHRQSFDPDFLRYESAEYRRENEKGDASFTFFGSRLAALQDEVENPTPRGWLQKWLQKRSGARYIMMATLIGVVIAITLGVLGLAVACFQAWVTYQQWKHPVDPRTA